MKETDAMSNRWLRMGPGLGVACLALAAVCCPAPAKEPAKPAARPDDAAALAARIDQFIDEGYKAKSVTPTAPADDAEFMRRLYLDLTGRIPRVMEVQDFLAKDSPDKRRELVDKLLNSPQYVTHMTHVWRALMLPNNNNQQVQFLAPSMESWLRKRFLENTPYDQMVRELLTANVAANRNGPPVAPGQPGATDPTAQAFYQANELKPENIAGATARLFMGVKIECAQCHNHPFAKWSREQFWEYTAFFSGIGPQGKPNPDDDPTTLPAADAAHRHDIKMPGKTPGTFKTVQARFLDGTQPAWNDDKPTRAFLAEWMTSPDNPYFARAAVNRVWSHFFGFGLTDPPDDAREDNPASHPELLDALAQDFVAHKFDLKYLIRAITMSKAYQLSSAVVVAPGEEPDEPRLYTRMSVKGLTAEQLFDSLALATYYTETANDPNGAFNPFGGPGGARAEFLTKFSNVADKRTETQTSILQALSLMNGKFTADASSVDAARNRLLGAAIDAHFTGTRGKLDMLYLAVLSRPMRDDEAEKLVKYVDKGGPSGNKDKALADVFWVLLNSSEFILNH
jgi:hypothetical protein